MIERYKGRHADTSRHALYPSRTPRAALTGSGIERSTPLSSDTAVAASRPSLVAEVRRWTLLLVALVAAAAFGWSIANADFDRMLHLAKERYGPRGTEAVSAWRQMLIDSEALDERGRLERVNAFFNRRTAFENDSVIWQQNDYWATPLETLGRAAGDCEDFAIAKYMSLRLLGIPADRLRLIYVRAQIGSPDSGVSQAHMVLGYYPAPLDEPLVLDNLIGEIRPAARRPDLFPVFSFNSEGLWVGGATASSADPTTRLSRWRAVLDRMRQEGL